MNRQFIEQEIQVKTITAAKKKKLKIADNNSIFLPPK